MSAQITAVQTSTGVSVDAIRRNAERMREIERFTSTVATSLQEQNVATGEISQNVASAAEGAKVVVSMLDHVVEAVGQTQSHAATVLKASETVAAATAKLQENVDNFLHRVAI